MDKLNFEQSIIEIENIIKQLEANELDLDKSLELYEKGISLTNKCYLKLNEIEKQSIKILSESEINNLKEVKNNE